VGDVGVGRITRVFRCTSSSEEERRKTAAAAVQTRGRVHERVTVTGPIWKTDRPKDVEVDFVVGRKRPK